MVSEPKTRLNLDRCTFGTYSIYPGDWVDAILQEDLQKLLRTRNLLLDIFVKEKKDKKLY